MLLSTASTSPPPPPFTSHLIAFKHVLWLQTLACINFWRFASECLVSLRYFSFFVWGLSYPFYVVGPALPTPPSVPDRPTAELSVMHAKC